MADERGTSLTEFALVLPVLLLLLLAMVDFGKAVNSWIDQTHLANEGARMAMVNNNPGSARHYDQFGRGALSAYLHLCSEQDVEAAAPMIDDLAAHRDKLTEADAISFLRSFNCILQKGGTEPMSLIGPVDRQSAQQDDRDWVRHIAPNIPRCIRIGNGSAR